ncbi:MAG: arginine--tRNA ligase [Gemmatimonadota bacterium]
MSQNAIRKAIMRALVEIGGEAGLAPSELPKVEDIRLERPRDPSHGDVATNVAMTLAGLLRRPPRAIAEDIAKRIDEGGMEDGGIEEVSVAGPGFLNFRLSTSQVSSQLADILAAGPEYGRSETGRGESVMVEFVSANPTGPLHLGHGRQAALGDAISELLAWTGWKVHREFYYNDAGMQIARLTESVRARFLEHLGHAIDFPEDGYHGEYVRDIAVSLSEKVHELFPEERSESQRKAFEEKLLERDEWAMERVRIFAIRRLRAEQDRDLTDFRVHFDHHFLESSLYTDGAVEETTAALRETGLVYEREGATWFRSTEFGDQKDRVMVKSDGSPTYFLPDVAYHRTKWDRGFHTAINVQGADHHGTVARVRAGLRALGLPEGYPEYVLHQMVSVERGGVEVKLSKRAGSYTTLRDLMEEVGVDVTRYFFQMRKPEGHLVFDLDVALDQSEKNPVFKSQYAHARMCSIFARGGISTEDIRADGVDLSVLGHPEERELVKELGEFPETVERAARDRAPHLVCDYLERTAGAANSWYHAGNPSRNPEMAVLHDDPALRNARLVLALAVRTVLANGLRLLGLTAPDRMVREEEGAPAGDTAGNEAQAG